MIADCIRFSSVIPSYKFRSLVKPGITGLAQIKGYRGPAKDHESIVNRYYWDAVYVRKAGLWLEIKIICKTIARGLYNLAIVFSDMVKKRTVFTEAANSSLS
jgi:putative colanic acid biosynthesis UDP-glucose lipid carrier transferase